MGVRQLELRRLGDPHAIRGRQASASSSTPRTRRCARARTAGWPRRPTTTRARCTWTPSRAPLGVDAVEYPAAASEGRADARRAHGGGAEVRMAASVGGRPRARHRVRDREGQLRRDRRGSQPRRERVHRRTSRRRLRVRRDRQPGRPEQSGRGLGGSGPGRRAVRGDRVRRRRHRQRHHGALPRAALQGRPAASRSSCSIARICRRRAPGRRRSCASRPPSGPRCARSARWPRSCPCGWCKWPEPRQGAGFRPSSRKRCATACGDSIDGSSMPSA